MPKFYQQLKIKNKNRQKGAGVRAFLVQAVSPNHRNDDSNGLQSKKKEKKQCK